MRRASWFGRRCHVQPILQQLKRNKLFRCINTMLGSGGHTASQLEIITSPIYSFNASTIWRGSRSLHTARWSFVWQQMEREPGENCHPPSFSCHPFSGISYRWWRGLGETRARYLWHDTARHDTSCHSDLCVVCGMKQETPGKKIVDAMARRSTKPTATDINGQDAH